MTTTKTNTKLIIALIVVLALCLSLLMCSVFAGTVVADAEGTITTESALTDAISGVAEGGTITLGDDIVLESALSITTSASFTLDLNGHQLSRSLAEAEASGYVIYIGSSANVTITSGTDEDGDGVYTAIAGTITGGNNTTSGGGIYNEGTITINNVSITDNKVTYSSGIYGGGIYNTAGTLTINHSTISGNTAYWGGGIYNCNNANLTIEYSAISGNTAYYGGGVYIYSGTADINYSTISDNTAINYGAGGGIYNKGTVYLDSSTITGNIVASSSRSGAGIYQGSDLYIYGNTTVIGNYNNSGAADNIFITSNNDVDFSDDNPFTGIIGICGNASTISSAWSTTHTGAVLCDNSGYYIAVSDNTLTKTSTSATVTTSGGTVTGYDDFDTALSAAKGSAGSTLTLYDDVDLTSSISITTSMTLDLNGYTIDRGLSDSDAVDGGYVISSSGTVTITSGVYVEATGTYSADMGTITGGNNSSSDTTYMGGGIFNTGTLTLYNISISDNTGYYGGGIFNNGSSLYVEDCSITDNTASTHGGGIALWANANTATINNSTITNNTVGGNFGGGIILWSSSNKLNIYGNTIITDNYKTDGSANNAYLNSNTVITFDNTEDNAFTGSIGVTMNKTSGNITKTYGGTGTVTSDNASYVVAVSTTANNGYTLKLATALASVTIGDDVYSFATLAEAVAYANSYTDEDNSDILITMLGNADTTEALTFSNTTNAITLDMAGYTIDRGLSDSEAVEDGYVIYVASGANVTITSGTDNGNGNYSADMGTITGGNNTTSGGGIYNLGTLTVSNIEISGNTANYGGGIYSKSATLTIEYSEITSNTASTSGGGVYVYGGTANISNSTISYNTASGSNGGGGGVYVNNSAVVYVCNSTISGNIAANGGGICDSSGSAYITDSTISYNTADNGGGVYIGSSGRAYITDSTISYNTADNGGGVYSFATPYIYGSTTVTGNVSGGTVSVDGEGNYSLADGTANNIELYSDKTIVFDDTADKAFTGTISVVSTSGNISTKWSTTHTGAVLCDNSGYYVAVSGNILTVTAAAATVTTSDGTVTGHDDFDTALSAAQGSDGSTLTLLDNVALTSGIVISTNMTLDLNGYTIDRGLAESEAEADGYVIYVASGANVTITSGTSTGTGTFSSTQGVITGGYTEYGGGINNAGTLTIRNIEISENTSYSNGGGIYSYGDSVYLAIEYSTISGNYADTSGGGIYSKYTNSELSITNSTITDNTATYGGGVVISSGTATITNSTISGNEGTSRSGGVEIGSNATVIIDSCTISGNTAGGSGAGGIYNYGTLYIYGSTTVTGNAKGGTITDGTLSGGTTNNIYISTDKTIEFYNSEDSTSYSAFTGEIGVTMKTAGQFSSTWNYVGEDATVASDSDSYDVLLGSSDGSTLDTLSIGTALASVTIGDDVYSFGSLADAVTYANSYTDEDNSDILITMLVDADTTEALTFSNTTNAITLDMAGYTIDRGLAESEAEADGYVIYVASGANVTITSGTSTGTGTFSSTQGVITGGYTSYGGGINNAGTLTISNIEISGNKASTDGGGVYSNPYASTTLTISYSTITDNYAGSEGGGIRFGGSSSQMTIEYSQITNNTSYNAGGGVRISAGTVSFSYVDITGNSSVTTQGGGIYINGGTVTIEDSNILGNSSDSSSGGGIYFSINGGTLTIEDSVISGNIADDSGGGIYIGYGTVEIDNVEVSYNTSGPDAWDCGGGIYVSSGTLIAIDSTISYNTAGSNTVCYGGGIYVGSGTLYIYGSTTVTGNVKGGEVSGDLSSGYAVSGGTTNNIYLSSSKTIDFSGTDTDKPAFTGTVGVTMANTSGNISTTYGGTGTVTSDDSSYVVMVNGSTLTLGNIADAAALVTIGDGSMYFTTLALAVDYANSYTGVVLDSGEVILITMLGDASITSTLTFTNTTNAITLNMSGHEIGIDSGDYTVISIDSGATVTITSTDVNGNYTNTQSTITGGYSFTSGGGIYNNGTLTISNISITNNYSSIGGGIYNAGTLTVIDSAITGNYSSYGGGIYNNGTLTIGGDTTVTGNQTGWGSAPANNIYLASGATIEFDSSNPFTGTIGVTMAVAGEFSSTWDSVGTGATVTSDNSDYIIVFDEDTATVAAITVTVTIDSITTYYASLETAVDYANKYTSTIADGNGILITMLDDADTGAALTFSNTTNAITLDMNGYTIDRGLTTATTNGYVIKVNSGVTVIITSTNGSGEYSTTQGTITGGNTTDNGGGIYNDGTLTISNIEISGNTSSNYGGGIYVNRGTVTITDSTITGNTAGTYGGGIYSYSTLIISGSTITGNTAGTYGGGVFMPRDTQVNITDSTISYNTAGTYGGGMYFTDAEATITNSTVSYNTAGSSSYSYGGGIYVNSGTLYIYGSTTVTGNVSGGTVTGSVGSYVLENGTINNIYLASSTTITFSGTDDYIAFTGSIGVTMNTAGQFSSSWNEDDFSGTISSDASGYTVVYSGTAVHLIGNSDSYTITYVTIESITTNSNATSYTFDSSTINLTDATVTGATFLGWFDSEDNEVTTIASGSFGDITLYAHYSVTAPTGDSSTFTYNGDEQTYGIVSTALYTVDGNEQTDADTYTVTVSLVTNCFWSDGSETAKTFDFVIAKADTVITTTGVETSYTYNGDEQSVTTGATANHSESNIVYSNNTFTTVGTGSYTITISVADSDNYNGASTTVDITVAKAVYDMTGITFEGITVAYSGSEFELVIGGTLPTGVTVDYTTNTLTNAGSVEVTATFTGDTANYELIDNMTATLTVTKAQVSAPSADSTEFTYTGNEQTYALATDSLYTIDGDSTTQTSAGTYTITLTLVDSDNYEWAQGSVIEFSFVIAKAVYDMTGITFEGITVAYSGSEFELVIGGTLPTGVTVDYTTNTLTNAGSVEVTATFTGDTANYELIDNMTATLTVTKAQVSAPSADSTEFTYTGSEQTYALATDSLYTIGGDSTTQTSAGTYTITLTLVDSDNYEWAQGSVTEFSFVIAKAATSATVDTEDLTYGGSAPTVSTEFGTEVVLYTGTTNSGEAYSSTTAPTEAGDYTVTVTVTGTSDYDGFETSTDFTIDRAAGIADVVISEDWSYGDALSDVFSYITTTNDNSDVVVEYRIYSDTLVRTMSLSTTTEWSTVAPTDAGTYEVRITYAETYNYYEVVYQDTFIIAQVSVESVTPTATSITYGDTLVDSTLSGTASVDGSWYWNDSTIAPAVSDSGTTTYTVVFAPSDSVNYIGFATTVTVTVAKAVYDMSGITFADSTVTYSGTAQSLAISGALPSGVTVSYTGNSQTEVGAYTVTASFAGDTDNYEAISDMTATLTVNAVVVDDTDTSTEEGTLWWLILILGIAVVVEAVFIMLKLNKNKKQKNKNTKMYAVSPLAFLLTVPACQLAVIAVLAVLAIAGGIILAVLYSNDKETDNDSQPVAKEKVVVATPSGAVQTVEEVEPVVATAQPAAEVQPVVATAQLVVAEPQPTVAEPQPAVAVGTEPASEPATVMTGVVAMTQPKVASDDEVGFGGIDATGKAIIIRYSKSFTAKLIQSGDIIQGYYTELKNALHSYSGVKSRISWKWDSINAGKTKLAKFTVRGKSLYLYLALDPAELEGTKYKVTTAAAKAYVATPCLYKVNGPRKLKFALELVAMLATKLGLTEGKVQSADYHKPYETTQALLEQKLIKELISKRKYQEYMDKYQEVTSERKFVSATEVGSMMTTEQATAEMTASTEQYASEVASSSTTATKSSYKVVGNKTAVVNVDTLSATFSDGDTVTLDELKSKGLIAKNTAFVKVLARGTCSKSLSVVAHDFSIDAVKMILLTGGKVIKVAKY